MVALGERLCDDGFGGGFCGGLGSCFRHGRNLGVFARINSLGLRHVPGFLLAAGYPEGVASALFP
jgi:hypothetical protein